MLITKANSEPCAIITTHITMKVIYRIKIGFIGLGKLGMPCAETMVKKGFHVTGYDIVPKRSEHVEIKNSIKELVEDAYKMNFDPADLFYKFYPYEGCDPASHYGVKRSWEDQLVKRAKEMSDE